MAPVDTPAISAIQEAVCQRYGVTVIEIISERRDLKVVDARHVGMWLARRASYTFPVIGEAFGGRHHTSVMLAVRRIDAWMKADADVITRVNALARKLKIPPVKRDA